MIWSVISPPRLAKALSRQDNTRPKPLSGSRKKHDRLQKRYPTLTDRKRERPDDYFADWKEREALAEGMIPIVGRLSREKSVK